jgi:hypothetical protein
MAKGLLRRSFLGSLAAALLAPLLARRRAAAPPGPAPAPSPLPNLADLDPTDPCGKTTTFCYDSLRCGEADSPAGARETQCTWFIYDGHGRLVKVEKRSRAG